MADVSLARTGTLLRKLFEILLANPDGIKAGEALRRLEEAIPPTPFEAGNFDSGVRRFDQIVRFATVDCAKAGWMVKDSGTWSVTDLGVDALRRINNPEAFCREAKRLYRAWRAGRSNQLPVNSDERDDEIDAEHDTAIITLEQAQERAWTDIERHFRTMLPYDLQDLVADLLKAMGYHIAWIAPAGPDKGIDVIAYTDPLGIKPPRIKVQVKRRSDTIPPEEVRAFLATINDHDVGIFVATGGFTKSAQEFARSQERRQMTLIDLRALVQLWIDHWGRLSDSARRRLPLTPIYFLTPSEI